VRDGSLQEPDAGPAGFVAEDLEVRDAAAVVDRDVDVFPTGVAGAVITGAAAGDAMTGRLEPAELLDVDMDELAGVASAVAIRRLDRIQARPAVQPETGQHRTHRRGRHPQLGRDARARPTQPT